MRRSCSHLYQESSWKENNNNQNSNSVNSLLAQIQVTESDFSEALKALNFGAEKFDIYQPAIKPLDSATRLLLDESATKCQSWFNVVSQAISANDRQKGSCFSLLIHSQVPHLGASLLMADVLSMFRKHQSYHIHSLNLFQLIFNVS